MKVLPTVLSVGAATSRGLSVTSIDYFKGRKPKVLDRARTEQKYSYSFRSFSDTKNTHKPRRQLTIWSKILLKKLIVTEMVNKYPGFYET